METAEIIITGIEYYLYVGGIIAALFLIIGLERIDPSARGAYAFRPLLIPGICLLWPVVLMRWFQLEVAKGKDVS